MFCYPKPQNRQLALRLTSFGARLSAAGVQPSGVVVNSLQRGASKNKTTATPCAPSLLFASSVGNLPWIHLGHNTRQRPSRHSYRALLLPIMMRPRTSAPSQTAASPSRPQKHLKNAPARSAEGNLPPPPNLHNQAISFDPSHFSPPPPNSCQKRAILAPAVHRAEAALPPRHLRRPPLLCSPGLRTRVSSPSRTGSAAGEELWLCRCLSCSPCTPPCPLCAAVEHAPL